MHLPTKFGGNIFIQSGGMEIFWNSIWRSPPSWIFIISEFGTFRRHDCLFIDLCTKFNSNISYNRWKRSNIWSRRSTDDVIGINFLFRFLSLWHLSVVVLYRRTKFCANIFIQYRDNYELFTKFNLPTDRHLGFVAGSRMTTHEGLILCKNFFMIVFVMFRL